MPIPLVVPDASVLLKWVLSPDDEPDADKALLLRTAIVDDAVRALLPALWLYEVGNTIARRFPTHALDWLSALMKFGLEEAPASHPWLAKTSPKRASGNAVRSYCRRTLWTGCLH